MARDIKENIRALIATILDRANVEINQAQSLTADLGFDSMQLMQFFAGIEDHYPQVRLEEWFLDQSQEGQDTIGSLYQFISHKTSLPEAFAA
jgi:acyl carrier protein